uniref:Uncharacterized protein n=1 Tax=Nelumbo nucifera TaxID=4432 RepID=A0A822YLN5_NELNU|nr:TPA_asm: hypothetical protein HUJ06_012293 [Nelumbo nucifera]
MAMQENLPAQMGDGINNQFKGYAQMEFYENNCLVGGRSI